MTDWSAERTSVSVGSESASVMPCGMSDGPLERITTVFGDEPPITNPPISTSPPVSTCMRVEMLTRRGGFAETCGAIWMEKACASAPNEFVVVTLPLNVPAAVGVPERRPEAVSSVRPGGSAPEVSAKVGAGDPSAAYWCTYAAPRTPFGGDPLVTRGAFPGLNVTLSDAGPAPTALMACTEQE